GTPATLVQVYNIAWPVASWPFFVGIVYTLVTPMAQFARMILLLPEWTGPASPTRTLFCRLGFVKTAVIDCELAVTRLAVDFDETMTEQNFAPGVILLCLHGRGNHRIDAND